MGAAVTGTRRRRMPAKLVQGIAAGLVGAVLVGAAVVAAGFDVKQTPVNDASIWALQSGDGNRYARVNTELGEIDTIKTVRNPSALAQNAQHTLLFAQNNEQLVDVDAVQPLDFDSDGAEYTRTPAGTVQVESAGDTVAYRTSTGSVFVARISDGAAAQAVAVDPYAGEQGEERRFYRSDAIALGGDGTLLSYSATERTILRYDIADATFSGSEPVADGPTDAAPQLSLVGDTWALASGDGGRLWLRGQAGAVDIEMAGRFVLQRPSARGTEVYLADERGLVAVETGDGTVHRVLGDGAQSGAPLLGMPAQPTLFDGEVYAAWLPTSAAEGTLWSGPPGTAAGRDGEAPADSTTGARALDFAGLRLDADAQPVFQGNGSRLILNDLQSGWVWTIPDGALVPSSQDWGVLSNEQQQSESEEEQAGEVLDPKPPVAEPDAFGARAGQLTVLPVLLNDHDPNTDVLTVLPASLGALPEDFGTLSLTGQSQSIVVQLAAGASGSASFSYAVTDGTRSDGLNSEPATVTVTVRDELANEAPVWCGTAGCLAEWPTPELAPGGTVTVPVLRGWVDPDGDPFFVSGAVVQGGEGSVGTTQAGEVVYRHPDAGITEPLVVTVLVTVSDTRGATSEKPLSILVTPSPQLGATPFALTTAVDEPVTVDPAPFLNGVSGIHRIISATAPSTAQGATVTLNSGASTFDFTATSPGEYIVRYSVADAANEVASFVRVTVLAHDAAGLSTAPVTVFVRPRADASVDVFTAVSNPSARVLLVSEPHPEPAPGAALEVSVVGQKLLRMRGTTADEQPGPLGVVGYTVSDGTGDPRFTAQGRATVYLLPAPTPQPPIAVADSIVVRAGTQVDIPVLANDVAPDGNLMVLDPDSIVNTSGEGLAFASGSTLRYLAPAAPGDYELRYSIATSGAPELTDNTTVLVSVTPDGDNQKPLPRPLTGRVLSGETVRVPFDSFGVDPDGDAVSLDRVLNQPASGTASIAATGDAIVYTSVRGFRGPVQFSYRVRDAHGETGTSVVRIGVLDEQSDPSPVTFSDYVQVQAGADAQVVLFPAANDIDPAGGELTLGAVSPDAPPGSDEYATLAGHILSADAEGAKPNAVVLRAGTEAGTMAFTYTVENSRGDVGVGLIVMKVVRASTPDHPVIADTVLTLDEREDFAAGIDVVSGKVTWTAGDVNGLTLSIWGPARGVRASGWELRGEAPDAGLLLPFALTGTSFAGTEVTSYGFLRVPAVRDVILTLKPELPPQTVRESEKVTFDMAQLVAVPEGASLEVARSGVAASGQRPSASCAPEGATRVSYTAAEGQPWQDSCVVPVRLAGDDGYTHLAVPIEVVPRDPQPELRPASVTASPAGPVVVYDLNQMVQWQGKAAPATLVFVVEQAADQFEVSQDGARLTIRALDTAVPGRENPVTVRLGRHPETPAAVLSLRVGPAPSTLPKGGTVAKECSQAAGPSCTVEVIGAPGEVNVFGSTPLRLVSVSPMASCTGVSLSVDSDSRVRAEWGGDTPGGVCQAGFQVQDAQGKRSAGDRDGSVTIDLQGFPRPPSGLAQTGFGDGSITLSVNPGEAGASHPALQGFRIFADGVAVGDCAANGVCPPITGLANGAQTVYEARSVNAVGTSPRGSSTTAWAYNAPGVGEITAEPVYDAALTTAVQGAVSLSIRNTDASSRGYLVNGVEHAASAAGSGTTTISLSLGVGQQTLTVQSLSRFPRPSGIGPADTHRSVSVLVAGLPSVSASGALSVTDTSITAPTAQGAANNSARPASTVYVAVPSSGAAQCVVDSDGQNLRVTGLGSLGRQSATPTISGLRTHTDYTVSVCFSNGFGVATQLVGDAFTWQAPAAPTGYSYTVSGADGAYAIDQPTSSEAVPAGFERVFTGYPSSVWGADPGISVAYCVSGDPARCSAPAAVGPAAADRQWQLQLDAVTLVSCTPGSALGLAAAGPGTEAAAPLTGAVRYEYFVPSAPPEPGPGEPAQPVDPAVGEWLPAPSGGPVPATATAVRAIDWSLAWGAPEVAGLGPVAGTLADEYPCTP